MVIDGGMPSNRSRNCRALVRVILGVGIGAWLNLEAGGNPPFYPSTGESPANKVVCSHSFHAYNVHMNELAFEWDPNKDKANVRKHGVSFEQARTAFFDENAIQFYDPDHSEGEDRFILLGLSVRPQVLVVCHCYRESETLVRIISARTADKDEELAYWERRQ